MGYSKSRKTLDSFRHNLVELEQGSYPTWEIREGQADQFAYKVREALYIACLYKEDYPTLAAAAREVRVVVPSPSKVQIKAKVGTPEAKLLTETAVAEQGLAEAGAEADTQSADMTALQVIQAWHQRQPSNDKMHFPKANLSAAELVKLHNWCNERTPAWLMFEFDGALTLQPFSRDIADMAWTPEDLR